MATDESWLRGIDSSLEGLPDLTTLDLKDAYRQLKILDEQDRVVRRALHIRRRKLGILQNKSVHRTARTLFHVTDAPGDEVSNELLRRAGSIDKWQTQLRNRALELSRTKLGGLNILDIPLEIIHQITDQFQDVWAIHNVQGDWNRTHTMIRKRNHPSHLQDIKNMRLVCRLFNQSASLHLCPTLTVELNSDSLDRAEAILSNPWIAAGVRSVELILAFRPARLARDIRQFARLRMPKIHESFGVWDYFCAARYSSGERGEDGVGGGPLPVREYGRAKEGHRLICAAWAPEPIPCQEPGDERHIRTYRQLLHQAHEEYRQRHEDQVRLVTDGSFVSRLAKGLSRTGHGISLMITDEAWTDRGRLHHDEAKILIDNERLYRFLMAPFDWRAVEGLYGDGVEIVPARLLSQFPIALRKLGGSLTNFSISCFPVRRGFQVICPDDGGLTSPAWDDLRLACLDLRTFEFGRIGLNHLSLRDQHPIDEDCACINKFFGMALSGNNLERVHINMYSLGLSDSSSTWKDWYPLGPVLSSVDWPKIKLLQLQNLSFKTAAELEALCSTIARQAPGAFLTTIELKKGKWMRALDILREGFAPGFSKTKLNFSLVRPTGGEFGKKVRRPDNVLDWAEIGSARSEQPLVAKSQQYAIGDPSVKENPLREEWRRLNCTAE